MREFARQGGEELSELERQIKEGSCQPKPVRRVQIKKPGSEETRPRGLPAVRDRGSPAHGPPLFPSAASVVDADITGYFEHIPHDQLLAKVRGHLAEGRWLGLIEKFHQAGVIEGLKGWQPTQSGTPQGTVLSPLLANLSLDELDHPMAAHGHEMPRSADDRGGGRE